MSFESWTDRRNKTQTQQGKETKKNKTKKNETDDSSPCVLYFFMEPDAPAARRQVLTVVAFLGYVTGRLYGVQIATRRGCKSLDRMMSADVNLERVGRQESVRTDGRTTGRQWRRLPCTAPRTSPAMRIANSSVGVRSCGRRPRTRGQRGPLAR